MRRVFAASQLCVHLTRNSTLTPGSGDSSRLAPPIFSGVDRPDFSDPQPVINAVASLKRLHKILRGERRLALEAASRLFLRTVPVVEIPSNWLNVESSVALVNACAYFGLNPMTHATLCEALSILTGSVNDLPPSFAASSLHSCVQLGIHKKVTPLDAVPIRGLCRRVAAIVSELSSLDVAVVCTAIGRLSASSTLFLSVREAEELWVELGKVMESRLVHGQALLSQQLTFFQYAGRFVPGAGSLHQRLLQLLGPHVEGMMTPQLASFTSSYMHHLQPLETQRDGCASDDELLTCSSNQIDIFAKIIDRASTTLNKTSRVDALALLPGLAALSARLCVTASALEHIEPTADPNGKERLRLLSDITDLEAELDVLFDDLRRHVMFVTQLPATSATLLNPRQWLVMGFGAFVSSNRADFVMALGVESSVERHFNAAYLGKVKPHELAMLLGSLGRFFFLTRRLRGTNSCLADKTVRAIMPFVTRAAVALGKSFSTSSPPTEDTAADHMEGVTEEAADVLDMRAFSCDELAYVAHTLSRCGSALSHESFWVAVQRVVTVAEAVTSLTTLPRILLLDALRVARGNTAEGNSSINLLVADGSWLRPVAREMLPIQFNVLLHFISDWLGVDKLRRLAEQLLHDIRNNLSVSTRADLARLFRGAASQRPHDSQSIIAELASNEFGALCRKRLSEPTSSFGQRDVGFIADVISATVPADCGLSFSVLCRVVSAAVRQTRRFALFARLLPLVLSIVTSVMRSDAEDREAIAASIIDACESHVVRVASSLRCDDAVTVLLAFAKNSSAARKDAQLKASRVVHLADIMSPHINGASHDNEFVSLSSVVELLALLPTLAAAPLPESELDGQDAAARVALGGNSAPPRASAIWRLCGRAIASSTDPLAAIDLFVFVVGGCRGGRSAMVKMDAALASLIHAGETQAMAQVPLDHLLALHKHTALTVRSPLHRPVQEQMLRLLEMNSFPRGPHESKLEELGNWALSREQLLEIADAPDSPTQQRAARILWHKARTAEERIALLRDIHNCGPQLMREILSRMILEPVDKCESQEFHAAVIDPIMLEFSWRYGIHPTISTVVNLKGRGGLFHLDQPSRRTFLPRQVTPQELWSCMATLGESTLSLAPRIDVAWALHDNLVQLLGSSNPVDPFPDQLHHILPAAVRLYELLSSPAAAVAHRHPLCLPVASMVELRAQLSRLFRATLSTHQNAHTIGCVVELCQRAFGFSKDFVEAEQLLIERFLQTLSTATAANICSLLLAVPVVLSHPRGDLLLHRLSAGGLSVVSDTQLLLGTARVLAAFILQARCADDVRGPRIQQCRALLAKIGLQAVHDEEAWGAALELLQDTLETVGMGRKQFADPISSSAQNEAELLVDL